MNKKNCIIIHGCPANIEKAMSPETRTYDKHWIPWTKRKLEENGIKTDTPLMPTPWAPTYDNFKKEFEKYSITSETILVGTSCGCSFLVRWLGETKQSISKLILVAPWKISDKKESYREFYEFPIDSSIKERVKEIVMFTSDNESIQGKEGLKMFHSALGGRIIDIPGYGHYLLSDMGTEEFPKLIDAITK